MKEEHDAGAWRYFELGLPAITSAVTEMQNAEDLLPMRLSFLRNFTIEQAFIFLEYLCLRRGLSPRIFTSGYDSAMQEVLNYESDFNKSKPSLVIVALSLRGISQALWAGLGSHEFGEISTEGDRAVEHLAQLTEAVRERCNAPILIHNFEVPATSAPGIIDYQEPAGVVNTVRRLNMSLTEFASQSRGVYVLDLDLLQSTVGRLRCVDERLWHIGRALYSIEGLKTLALEYTKFIFALTGKQKKCLVLDCDNTLWGGIIGEDGIDGIKIGQAYPGSAYRDFQRTILDLHRRGVILAICTKNNEQDIKEVFEDHPGMILKEDHIAAIKANWHDKVANLQEIAGELNIGLDSLVFVDDSEIEVDMVRQFLPEVETLLLPRETTAFSEALLRGGFFDSLTISDEDRARGQMYVRERQRREMKTRYADINEYLGSLEMDVRIFLADEKVVARLAQLTQRTNQFNLTTRRYTDEDIRSFIDSPTSDVLYLKLSDCFDDLGIVGMVIIRYEDATAVIDSFLMSCRALGRGVEAVLLKACLDLCHSKGITDVFGTYLETKKNLQVSRFFPDSGFVVVQESEGGARYRHDVGCGDVEIPCYFASLGFEIRGNNGS